MILPHPDHLSWDRWASTVVGFNPELSNQLHPNLDWESFASYLADSTAGAPQPHGFETWQDWVRALKLAVQS